MSTLEAKKGTVLGKFEPGIFFQSVDVDLLENFEHCDGIYLPNFTDGTIFGLNDKGAWLIDKMPWQFVSTYNVYNTKKRFIDIKTIAAGTTKRVYIKAATGLIGQTVTFIFRLTNKEPQTTNKRHKYFEIVADATAVTESVIYLDKNIKRINAVAQKGAGASLKISLTDDVRTYFEAVDSNFLNSVSTEPFENRKMPIQITKNKLIVVSDNPIAAINTYYLLFEFEPNV
jgi:hypothetical protein